MGSAQAASFDPQWQWATIKSEHFAITFHQGEEALAADMVKEAEEAWGILTTEIGSTPRGRVQLVLVDPTDSANGYATIIPNNQIVIFVTAPQEDSSLAYYEEWNEAIVTHELTHVLHLGTVGGLPQVGRYLLGRIVSPNLLSPSWVTEGFATFEETRQTAGGRGRAPAVDMIKRTAWLENKWPPLGNLDGYQAMPPAGNLRYVFGQDFMQFIANRSGSQKWSEWVQHYGASIPYFLGAKKVFGASFYELYKEWKVDVGQRYGAQVAAIEAQGVTPVSYMTDEDIGCSNPSYSPNGQSMVYGCYDLRKGSAIWISDLKGEKKRILIKNHSPKNIAWRADGKAIVFSELHVVDLYNTYEDLFQYDIEGDSLKVLTHGQRLHDPSFSPDGSRLIAVQNHRQENTLVELTVDGRMTPLSHESGFVQFGTPRYRPDGSMLAVSVWKEGSRDLWLYTAAGVPWRRLTHDMAIDREPAWSPDGRWLFFTSDRSGVPNLYAIDMEENHLFQVTNVITGAYAAAVHPDGQSLALEIFSTLGGRVATMPIDPQQWRDLGPLPSSMAENPPVLAQSPTPDTFDPLIAPKDRPKAKDWQPPDTVAGLPTEAYNPWPLAFPPRYWLPSGLLTNTGNTWGLLLYAATGGSDPLKQIAWSGYLSYRTDANYLGGGGSFIINRWRPVIGLSANVAAWPGGTVYVQPEPTSAGPFVPGVESAGVQYWERRRRGSVSLSYPVSTKMGVLGYYTATSRSPLDPLPAEVYNPQLPTRGFFSGIGAGWSWSNASAYTLSISPEKGRVLTAGAEYEPSWLGSFTYDDDGNVTAFDRLQFTAQWREYHRNPLLANHVFAFKLAGGASVGDHFRYGSFRLGGSWSEGGVTVVPDEWRALRGFYPATRAGESYWLGSGEYRFPIWRIDRGIGVLPLFLRNLSGAVFVDSGNAFDDLAGAALGNTLLGTGVELQAAMIVGWGAGINARMGYGFSAYGGGIPLGSLDGAYLALGGSF